MVLGKKAATFDWEWGRNLAPREGQKISGLGCCQVFILCAFNIDKKFYQNLTFSFKFVIQSTNCNAKKCNTMCS